MMNQALEPSPGRFKSTKIVKSVKNGHFPKAMSKDASSLRVSGRRNGGRTKKHREGSRIVGFRVCRLYRVHIKTIFIKTMFL